jgi:tetratricopeptide (TPR) repeat protein
VKLAERKFFNEERKSALSLLESVDSNLLDKEGAEKFIGMILEFRDSPILLNECHKILDKHFSNDCAFQTRLMNMMRKEGAFAFCEEFFKQQYAMHSKNAVANYMYAFFQTTTERKIELYKRALFLSPLFFQASLAFGKIYIVKQEWMEAKKQFLNCLRVSPSSLKSHYFLAVSEIKLTDSPKYIQQYEFFLRKTGIKESDILKEMIFLSQYMKTSKYTDAYLLKAAKYPELASFVEEQRIKTKFIYRMIKQSDFPKFIPSRLKFYHQLFLISKGRLREMMLIPTRRKDFPEFWKVFICWRTGIKSWRKNAELLLKRDGDDTLIATIAKLWLRKITPLNASALIDDLPYQEQPLLAIMVAEEYYREGQLRNSEFFYNQALHYSPPNIYIQLAEYLKRSK